MTIEKINVSQFGDNNERTMIHIDVKHLHIWVSDNGNGKISIDISEHQVKANNPKIKKGRIDNTFKKEEKGGFVTKQTEMISDNITIELKKFEMVE